MASKEVDRINIAIDGPAGAGKSTVAREVATALHYVYVDTGAMYRAITLHALRHNITADHSEGLQELISKLDLSLKPSSEGQVILLNGENITTQIRSRDVTTAVSHYAASEVVRTYLGHLQRELARNKGIVMDGRDIGSHVLPDAEVKIYLTASVKERAMRRFKELTKENYVSLEDIEKEIATRDHLDQTREIAPLIQAHDATFIDSSHLTIPEVVEQIVSLSKQKITEVC